MGREACRLQHKKKEKHTEAVHNAYILKFMRTEHSNEIRKQEISELRHVLGRGMNVAALHNKAGACGCTSSRWDEGFIWRTHGLLRRAAPQHFNASRNQGPELPCMHYHNRLNQHTEIRGR